MSELELLSAALRQAAVNLTSAAASVGRVLVSVADALEPEDGRAPAKRASARPRRKAAAPSARTRTSRSPAPRTQRTRGRRPSG